MNQVEKKCIAFFLQDLDGGGTERAIIALASELAKHGHYIELVVGDAVSDYRSEVSSVVNVVDFGTRAQPLVFWRLIAYLRFRKPTVIMSALDPPNIMLILAARLARYKGRTIISQRSTLDASLSELGFVRRMLMRALQGYCFPRADALISNSTVAASELCVNLKVPKNKVFIIHNSVDFERINQLANEKFIDRWNMQDKVPIILTVGSLTRLKDRSTLVRAFALVIAKKKANLVIVGKGYEWKKIERLISELQLNQYCHLVGFDPNPYKWMLNADVLVSSSITEGCPNNLLEALALDIPIVATDCPGDTAELLSHGKWGRLVPVGDPKRLAEAILAALDDPNPPNGRIRAADFSPPKITAAYLDVLLPRNENDVIFRHMV